jgi:hypothetical protein
MRGINIAPLQKICDIKVWLMLIYVGAILLLTDKDETKQLTAVFEWEFRWVMHSTTNEQSYLSMVVKLERGQVVLDMMHYTTRLLKGYNNLQLTQTPGGKSRVSLQPGQRHYFRRNGDSSIHKWCICCICHSTLGQIL